MDLLDQLQVLAKWARQSANDLTNKETTDDAMQTTTNNSLEESYSLHGTRILRIIMSAVPFLVASCDLVSPIKLVYCKTTRHSPGIEKFMKDPSFIINTKTGEQYIYDSFSGKLKSDIDGSERKVSGNSWISKKDIIYPEIIFRKYTYVEFNPMSYFTEHKSLTAKGGAWETLYSSEGKCWLGKLTTTEILK
jgi:hypothetical protein